jgi:hypothetical protein
MKMQRQGNSNDMSTLEMVASAQRRGIIRDRLVGAFLALGLLIGATAIESMARSANAPAKAPQTQVADGEQEPVMLAALVVDIVQ